MDHGKAVKFRHGRAAVMDICGPEQATVSVQTEAGRPARRFAMSESARIVLSQKTGSKGVASITPVCSTFPNRPREMGRPGSAPFNHVRFSRTKLQKLLTLGLAS
jgi:hypothetical protein